jgi:hypothetical protein
MNVARVIPIGYRMTGVIVVFIFIFGFSAAFFFGDKFWPFGKIFFQNTNTWNFFFKIAMFSHIVQPSRQGIAGF